MNETAQPTAKPLTDQQKMHLRNVMFCVSKKAKTVQDKYLQLKKDFKTLSREPQKLMMLTIQHGIKQAMIAKQYAGFDLLFWQALRNEYNKEHGKK